jgi:hypothetical protein
MHFKNIFEFHYLSNTILPNLATMLRGVVAWSVASYYIFGGREGLSSRGGHLVLITRYINVH